MPDLVLFLGLWAMALGVFFTALAGFTWLFEFVRAARTRHTPPGLPMDRPGQPRPPFHPRDPYDHVRWSQRAMTNLMNDLRSERDCASEGGRVKRSLPVGAGKDSVGRRYHDADEVFSRLGLRCEDEPRRSEA